MSLLLWCCLLECGGWVIWPAGDDGVPRHDKYPSLPHKIMIAGVVAMGDYFAVIWATLADAFHGAFSAEFSGFLGSVLCEIVSSALLPPR